MYTGLKSWDSLTDFSESVRKIGQQESLRITRRGRPTSSMVSENTCRSVSLRSCLASISISVMQSELYSFCSIVVYSWVVHLGMSIFFVGSSLNHVTSTASLGIRVLFLGRLKAFSLYGSRIGLLVWGSSFGVSFSWAVSRTLCVQSQKCSSFFETWGGNERIL